MPSQTQSATTVPVTSTTFQLPPKLPLLKDNADFRILNIAKTALNSLSAFLAGAALTTLILTGNFIVGGIVLVCALAALAVNRYIDKAKMTEIHQKRAQAFSNVLIDRVKACIQYNSQYTNKTEILSLLEAVKNNAHFIEVGNDDIRVKFVGSQGAFEHVLACSQALQELQSLIGAIHTPTPATPLCVRVNSNLANKLLDASIAHDLDKLLTVQSRAEIVRNYLKNGSELHICYPKGGLEKRTSAEQEVYQEELRKHPKKLIDSVLDCAEMDPDMIGATYLFRDLDNNQYSFSIKARQANDVQKQAEWGIWFGAISNQAIKNRVNAIFEYLKSKNGPDLRS